MGPLSWVVLLSALQAGQPTLVTGTLNDRPSLEAGMRTRTELKPSDDRDLPGVTTGDLVFRGNTVHFRSASSAGMAIALVETGGAGFLFVDANRDGRFTESERTVYTTAADYESAPDVALEIASPNPGGPRLPFLCRVASESGPRRYFYYTPTYRVEGQVDIGGTRTLVSLPFDVSRGTVDIRRGFLGIDANGDGRIDFRGWTGTEGTWMNSDRVIVRVRDRYVSVESADFPSHALVFREHPPEDYRMIDIRAGEPLPDFSFTDFDGAVRKLSDFKGKYLLMDFWGTWCAPCVADLPLVKAARDRFRERGFDVLGMDREYTATSSTVRQFLKGHDVTWPNATPDSVKDLIENRYRILGFPTLILLDPDGVVVEIGGSIATMMPRLEQLLEKR